MQILFDNQAFDMQQYGGVSRYYCETLPLLRESISCIIGVKGSDNIHLKESQLIPNLPANFHFKWGKLKNYNFLGKHWLISHYDGIYKNRKYSIELLKKHNYDIFEPTFFDSYFLKYLKGKPFVLTVHDMIPERYPQFFTDTVQTEQKKLLSVHAAKIFVPSQTTKDDLIDIFNINPQKIDVVYRGTNIHPSSSSLKITSYPYLLYIGARHPYKNFIPFLNAFANIEKKYKEFHVICTGPDFSEYEENVITQLGIKNKVHHITPSREYLADLYSNAFVFVYPSLYEGFGLPILEAFSCGCPVMLNNASCFPEVAGNAAIYFEMNESQCTFENQFELLVNMTSEQRYSLIKKGCERLSHFSWRKTVDIILKAYHSII